MVIVPPPADARGGWNYADAWERVADVLPDAPCLGAGDTHRNWAQVDRRADAIADFLLGAGLVHQDKVVHYLRNCPEYLESTFALFKAGLVPVNTNYRYLDDELVHLWDNADAVAGIVAGEFAPAVERLRTRVPRLRTWLWVDDGTGACPDWAVPYESAATSPPPTRVRPPERSGDDLYLLYTGGTTGVPKGVMWRQDDLLLALDGRSRERLPEQVDWAAFDARLHAASPRPRGLASAPLMHGTAALNAFNVLANGGSMVTLRSPTFDVEELLDTVVRERITTSAIVGDAFARPILAVLDAHPGRWDLSSLRVLASSGVMWSRATKEGLLRHAPTLMMVDTLGSSEAVGMATQVTDGSDPEGRADTGRFRPGPDTVVLDDDLGEVPAGSGRRGRVARRGHVPLGYYKDPEKTAATFVSIGGIRHALPGDYAEVEADGTIRLLGRGSVCINTGGEKVFPEEVEEVLKQHPSVADAVVVGVPDARFGERVIGVVELRAAPGSGGVDLDEASLIGHVRTRLAPYKAPKRIVRVATIGRAPNGKVDYRRLRDDAGRALADG